MLTGLLSTKYPPSPPMSSIMSPTWSSSASVPAVESPSFLNLEKVVQNYGNQPELLELILSSKVEEDRRRAEEAKLRRKEIDYLLQKQSTESQKPKKEVTLLPPIAAKQRQSASKESSLPRLHHHTKPLNHQYDAAPSNSTTWTNSNTPQYHRKTPPPRKNSNSIEMLLSPSPHSMDFKLPYPSTSNTNHHSNNKRSSSTSFGNQEHPAAGSAPPSPPIESNGSKPLHVTANKRRRREMQAITTIIETREFPYNDDYLWKNNGNTVHKKTGFKSIYYKCSNTAKGCPVNKTVTFQDNGEYLIKYRGEHLQECNRIKRITDL